MEQKDIIQEQLKAAKLQKNSVLKKNLKKDLEEVDKKLKEVINPSNEFLLQIAQQTVSNKRQSSYYAPPRRHNLLPLLIYLSRKHCHETVDFGSPKGEIEAQRQGADHQ